MIEIAAPMLRAMLIWDRRVAQSELSRYQDVVRALGQLFFETVAELLVSPSAGSRLGSNYF